jgi:hypothetical protein
MTGDDAPRHSRRALLGTAATGGLLGLAGCLTIGPSVTATGLSRSAVFESVTMADEAWASGRVAVKMSLTPTATTEQGVRKLTTVTKSGSKFDTAMVESGQTSATLYAPTHQRVSLSATDYDGKTVETVTIRVGGNKIL